MSGPLREPRSVEAIVKDAQNFDHKTQYALRITLRTAQMMLNQAVSYERDGNLEDAYLFFYRHAEFFFAQIAVHPEAKKPEYKPLVARVKDEVKLDLTHLEELKPELQKQYERFRDSVRKRDAARAALQEGRRKDEGAEVGDAAAAAGHAFTTGTRVLTAGEHNHVALRLANRELERRGAVRHGRSGDGDGDDSLVDDLSAGIRAIGRQLDDAKNSPAQQHGNQSSRNFSYPSVSSLASHDHPPSTPQYSIHTNTTIPLLPPKAPFAPTLPPKTIAAHHPQVPPSDNLTSTSVTFASKATTESGAPLRTLFLPIELRTHFLTLAAPNTASNLETCGILCASLISNALFVSHLVLPAQVSTSDTCEVTEAGDVSLFDFVDGEGLVVCGWIHTHPSQTCFLSSRDLHTSVGYQVMMPEAVAIVCAPSKAPDHGIFRLTDPPGKDAIRACHQPGIFHPHAQQNLYTDALRPAGHVSELKGLRFQVVDLRPGT